MKNYLYPIYKSKFAPWIKYWILKGNKIMPKVLSEVIEGTTPITIEGVYKGTSLQELIFKGQTIQEGTPSPEEPISIQVVKEDNYININEDSYKVSLKGNNLFDKDNANILNAFVNGNTGLLATQTSNQKSLAIPILANTRYTISGVERSASNYGLFSDTTLEIGTSIATTKGQIINGTMTFTSGDNDKWLVFLLKTGSETYGYDNVMLNKGSSALPYEPYYDYELCKIGNYQDKIKLSTGKNLFEGFSFTKTNSGITFTYNTDGSIKVNGTASADSTSMYSSEATNYLFTLESGTYTLSGVGLTANIRAEIVKSNGTLLAQTDNNLYKSFTISESTSVFMRLYVASDTAITTDLFVYPMLNKGSTALPYEPYGVGKWYIEKNIGKVVYNGSENWSLQRSGTANWYYRLTSAVTNFNYDSDRSNYLSNISTKASIGTSTTVVGMFLTNAEELRIRNTTEDTIANWEAFLGGTNMLLYYPLLTPTTTEITDTTLISQLEAIINATLISGTNEITQTPSDLPFILNFKYYMKG